MCMCEDCINSSCCDLAFSSDFPCEDLPESVDCSEFLEEVNL